MDLIADLEARGLIHDSTDLENGSSRDENRNGIPDECPDDAHFGHMGMDHGTAGHDEPTGKRRPWWIVPLLIFVLAGAYLVARRRL